MLTLLILTNLISAATCFYVGNNVRKMRHKDPAIGMLKSASDSGIKNVETLRGEKFWGKTLVNVISFQDGTVFRFSEFGGIPDIGVDDCHLNFAKNNRKEAEQYGRELVGRFVSDKTTTKLLSS